MKILLGSVGRVLNMNVHVHKFESLWWNPKLVTGVVSWMVGSPKSHWSGVSLCGREGWGSQGLKGNLLFQKVIQIWVAWSRGIPKVPS